ncbi:extracellular solute-binding protein [Herbiconiux moechotypicola]|uniref:Extracellular solute-binding protein n=1 Tax=Herbiconiux moechotypicola TaxID=637393 RepID=A0ABN3D8Q4_9MICO|nr:extracellular solute-binding protein [Herbiconiux moechotypicola]MCS5728210.1 extracellular solute-binding protein [Herbiconiux moechotypicola]
MRSTLRAGIGAAIAITALALTGCSGSSGGSDGPVELTYWGWAPNMEQIVDAYNESQDGIHVTYVKTDAGDPAVTKFLTAIQAGSGAPDLMQAEYQKIPTLLASDAIIDIADKVDSETEGKFSEGVWSSVTLGTDGVYALPQDSGPMMFYYREDIFDQMGLTVPTTWDEYAEVAKTVHEADPSKYLGTFSSIDPGQFAGLTQQAGASWWSSDDGAWGVDIDSEPVQEVASFWGGLVESGVIDNKPQYTPEWNAALNDGSQIGWVSSVWAPGVLAGNAPDTAGLWRMAPLPQWDASDPATGNWGGSAVAVSSQSQNVDAAVEFATWLNTSPEAVAQLVSVSGLYPADTADSAEALTEPFEFFSNQPDFYELAAEIADTVQPFTYGPNVNVAYSAFNDEFGKAAASKSQADFLTAVTQMQEITLTDLEDTGFTTK